MAIVQRGNRQLTVSAEAVSQYLADGFSEVDNKGKVLKPATGKKSYSVKDIKELKSANDKLQKENSELKSANDKLQKELQSLLKKGLKE